MDRDRRKEKQRLKRKERQRELRKRQLIAAPRQDVVGTSHLTPEQFEAGIKEAARRGVLVVSEWCRQNNLEPHPKLPEAMRVYLTVCNNTINAGKPKEQMADVFLEKLRELIRAGQVTDPQAHMDAVRQIFAMQRAVGEEMFRRMQNWKDAGAAENQNPTESTDGN